MIPDLSRRSPNPRRLAYAAFAWLAGLLLVAAMAEPAPGASPLQAAVHPGAVPQDATGIALYPQPRAEAEAGSGNMPPEVEEPGLVRAQARHCVRTDLRAAATFESTAPGKSPPRYRGQAPPAIV